MDSVRIYAAVDARPQVGTVRRVLAFFHWFGKLHRRVYALNGTVGRRFAWIPCLVLTTTGRKSGQRRDSVLVYADDSVGGGRVVVASNGGDDKPPAWLLNVQADGAVHVQVGNEQYDATARSSLPGTPTTCGSGNW